MLPENSHKELHRTQLADSNPIAPLGPTGNGPEPLVAAYHNGRSIRDTIVKMWRLVWTCHYAWLRPLDWYRWAIEGHEGSQYVCLKVTPLPRRFGIRMFTRGDRALTFSDYEKLEQPEIPLTVAKFQQLAARFNMVFADELHEQILPEALRPFFYYRRDEPGAPAEPAYRMHPDRERLLVWGVTPGQTIMDDDIDWSIFQTRPPSDVPDAEIDWTIFLLKPPSSVQNA